MQSKLEERIQPKIQAQHSGIEYKTLELGTYRYDKGPGKGMWSVTEELKHGGKVRLTVKTYNYFVNEQINVHYIHKYETVCPVRYTCSSMTSLQFTAKTVG